MNFKKIGLSALAGSLAMVSAAQADLTVTGSAEATYTTTQGVGVTGNPLGLSHDINFIGTGEVGGMDFSIKTNIAGQDMATDSVVLVIDAGDGGSFGIDQGSGKWGIGSLANKTPTAYEEADHSVGVLADGLDVTGDTNVFGYSNTFAGLGVSVEINPDTANATLAQAGATTAGGKSGTNYNYALTYAMPSIEGMTLFYGGSDTNYTAAGEQDDSEMTVGINWSMGAVKLGYQRSSIEDGTDASSGGEVEAFGIAFNVNDNLSVSYGISDHTADNPSAADVTEETTGIMAAFTVGGASIRMAFNEADNVGGVADLEDENMEISLALSF
jgi:outer membrane protein OmpU